MGFSRHEIAPNYVDPKQVKAYFFKQINIITDVIEVNENTNAKYVLQLKGNYV